MKSNDRIIVWALAISLALHAVFVTVVCFSRPVEAQEKPPTPAVVRIIVREPPPTPTPPPSTPQPKMPQPHVRPQNPHVAPPVTTDGGDHTGSTEPAASPGIGNPVDGDGSANPAPTDTPKPGCAVPNAAAAVVNAVQAEAPESAEGATGEAQVKVNLADTGAVLGVSIYTSTGNSFLDSAALRAARQSSYHAETRDCLPVGGSYLFRVDFQNQ